MQRQAWLIKLFLLIPLCMGSLLFFKVTGFEAVWDDDSLLSHPLIGSHSVSLFAAIVDALQGLMLSPGLYWRPLGSITFWAPTVLCPTSTEAAYNLCVLKSAHYINYILYSIYCLVTALTSYFVLKFATSLHPKQISEKALIFCATASALLITLHPAHAEIFAWIAGRFDGLLSLFLMVSIIVLFSKIKPSIKSILLFLLCSLGCLSKDGAQVGFSGIMVLSLVLNTSRKEKVSVASSIILAFICMFLLRQAFSGRIQFEGVYLNTDFLHLFHRYVSSTSQIFLSLTQPWIGISPAHPFKLGIREYVWSFVFHAGLVTCICLMVRSFLKDKQRLLLWTFGTLLFGCLAVAGLISSVLVINQDFVWADRYLAPIFPFFLGFISLSLYELHLALKNKINTHHAFVFLTGFYLLTVGLVQHQEIGLWKNNMTLWSRMVLEDPTSLKARNNYAQALYVAGNILEAEKQTIKAVELMETQGRGFYDVIRSAAAVKFSLGKNQEAQEFLTKWEKKGFDSFELRAMSGFIYYFEKKCAQGDVEHEKALEFMKKSPKFKSDQDRAMLSDLKAQCYQTSKN